MIRKQGRGVAPSERPTRLGRPTRGGERPASPESTASALRRTRIVATLGPASQTESVVEGLILAGLDVARVNFSHGEPADHARQIRLVRAVAERLGRNVAVLQDLQGPKIRVGRVAGGAVRLAPGALVELGPDDGTPGTAERLGVSLPNLARSLSTGSKLLIDDGHIRLHVLESRGDVVSCRVEVGGVVRDHKGVNAPDATLDVPSLTEKDIADLEFGTVAGVDFVALSFVRSAEDVMVLRKRLRTLDSDARVVAKFEKHEALGALDEIIAVSDAVMVARGDLGVEIPAEEVPRWQKAIIRRALAAGKAVITATQMLESMTDSPTPTRAEASDVANAVYDGTTALMLSGETAVGAYPVEAVATMARIAAAVERDLFSGGATKTPSAVIAPVETLLASGGEGGPADATEAISAAACSLAVSMGAAAILTPTRTGATARHVSRHRPSVPIVAATPSAKVRAQLALEWGVVPLLVPEAVDTDRTIAGALTAAREAGLAPKGRPVVVTCGAVVNVPGTTNVIKIETG